jgi:hypothetical protein
MKFQVEKKESASKELLEIWQDTGLASDEKEALDLSITLKDLFELLEKMDVSGDPS